MAREPATTHATITWTASRRFSGPTGDVLQRTELTARQAAILRALGVPEPPRIFGLAPAEAAVTA